MAPSRETILASIHSLTNEGNGSVDQKNFADLLIGMYPVVADWRDEIQRLLHEPTPGYLSCAPFDFSQRRAAHCIHWHLGNGSGNGDDAYTALYFLFHGYGNITDESRRLLLEQGAYFDLHRADPIGHAHAIFLQGNMKRRYSRAVSDLYEER